MIDIESQVYSSVVASLRGEFPEIETSSVEEYRPARFPFLCLREIDNYAYRNSQDSRSNENHDYITYQSDIYSTKKNGRKQEARAIQKELDTAMDRLGFTKISTVPMSDKEGTMYRLASRYTAVVSKNEVIYGR